MNRLEKMLHSIDVLDDEITGFVQSLDSVQTEDMDNLMFYMSAIREMIKHMDKN